MDNQWEKGRSGSHAGRGFHYQDAVATELAVLAWRGDLTLLRLIPEGLEDVSLELDAHPLHLQAKSRRAHRGDFSDSEVADGWRHLAERLAADPVAHVGLVLERPLRGADTGFELTLADLADPRLKSTVAAAVRGIVAPDEFLARAHLLVMPAAPATSVALLAERLGISPASCLAHYEILRGRLATLADENGEPHRSAADPAAMTVTDVAALLDDVSEGVDPSLLRRGPLRERPRLRGKSGNRRAGAVQLDGPHGGDRRETPVVRQDQQEDPRRHPHPARRRCLRRGLGAGPAADGRSGGSARSRLARSCGLREGSPPRVI